MVSGPLTIRVPSRAPRRDETRRDFDGRRRQRPLCDSTEAAAILAFSGVPQRLRRACRTINENFPPLIFDPAPRLHRNAIANAFLSCQCQY